MSELVDKLNRYIRQVDEGATLRFRLFHELGLKQQTPEEIEAMYGEFPYPRYQAWVHDEAGCPTKEVEIEAPSESEMSQEGWVALLAHEAGHVEQGIDIRGCKPSLPPTELDAWRRGIKWAAKWGVLQEYGMSFIKDADEVLPKNEDVERIIAQIDNLIFKW